MSSRTRPIDNDDGPQVLAGGEGWVQLHNCVVSRQGGQCHPAHPVHRRQHQLDHYRTVADGVVGLS